MSNEIPKILKRIDNSRSKILSFCSLNLCRLDHQDPLYMVFAEFNGNKINNLDIGQDVFTACSFLDETVSFTDGSSERNRMEKMLLRINAGTVFGFSRNCTTFASISRAKQSENKVKNDDGTKSQFLDAYKIRFNGPWLTEWILVIHQQLFMIDMKKRLGTADMNKRGSLFLLQSEFVKFTADSCFTQVTSDPTGAELYERWKKLFSLNDLNQEVSSQILALNNHVTFSIQRMVTVISFILFPISLILSILTFFQLNMAEVGIKLEIFIVPLTISILLWLIYVFGIKDKIKNFISRIKKPIV